MPNVPSLFAEKLRTYRAANGRHGRMTQEQLAEAMGVSVDAVGKYERSLSFIRGDLEHRLADCLGWSRDEILACREDWTARAGGSHGARYRLLDRTAVDTLFGGSWRDAARASIVLANGVFGDLPGELAANDRVFTPIYEAHPQHWRAVVHDGRMVAKWSMLFLMPKDEALFREGRLLESELSVDRLRQPILPGTYFGYCPALIVARGHEPAAALLLSSFVAFLESHARRDILFHGIGTISCSAGGTQLCRDLGMTRLTSHCVDPDFGVWTLDGQGIAASIFARRSGLVARSYGQAFAAQG